MKDQTRKHPHADNVRALSKGASTSIGSERDLTGPAVESKERPPSVQAGDRWFLHVIDNELQTELYFPERPPGLPGRYIRIDRVGDGWMDEQPTVFVFINANVPTWLTCSKHSTTTT
jgi:hypothetical protein